MSSRASQTLENGPNRLSRNVGELPIYAAKHRRKAKAAKCNSVFLGVSKHHAMRAFGRGGEGEGEVIYLFLIPAFSEDRRLLHAPATLLQDQLYRRMGESQRWAECDGVENFLAHREKVSSDFVCYLFSDTNPYC